jgi:uncharacterized protein YndB with AHSA1/START domain
MNNEYVPDELRAREVTVVRHLDATPEEVWRAWTEPAEFASWFCTPPFSTPASAVEMDVRVGGQWHATQVSSVDDTELPFVGVYREIEEPTRLVFTFEDVGDRSNPNVEVATVTLKETDAGTDMTFRQAGHMPPEQYQLLAEGYSRFFDQLEQYINGE